jgi:hypothetical protein
MTCQSIDPNSGPGSTQATLDIAPIEAALSVSPTSLTTGSNFTLTWSSTGAAGCTASGGGADGGEWSGSLAPSGSATQTATTAGTFTYSITCSTGTASSSPAEAKVTVSAPSGASSGGSSSSSSGKGGGGDLGFLELAALAGLLAWRVRAPRRALCGYFARQLA